MRLSGARWLDPKTGPGSELVLSQNLGPTGGQDEEEAFYSGADHQHGWGGRASFVSGGKGVKLVSGELGINEQNY